MNDELLAHIERLEKRSRVLFVLLASCISLVGALLVIGASRGIRDEIVARAIRVVGAAGKNAAFLDATEDGFVHLSLRDLNGDLRASLILTPSGKPTLAFFHDKAARLELGVIDAPKGEEFSLQLRDPASKPIWQPDVSNGY
jgi:hypothetical protein